MLSCRRVLCALFVTSLATLPGCGSSEEEPQGGAGTGGSAQAGTGGSAQAGAGNGGSQAGTAGSGGAASTVSYRTTIAPLFEASCSYCHYTGSLVIDIEQPFTPVTGLVASANTWADAHPEANLPQRNVVPGDPDNSFLMQKLTDPNLDPSTSGQPMPWQVARLTEAELTALRSWISAGALNDATFTSTIRPILGSETSLSGKCVHCHWSGGERPNLQDPFDPVTGAVGVTSERASPTLIIAPGDPDASFLVTKVTSTSLPPALGMSMPAHLPAFTDEDVAAVRTWIREGAQNN
jgi:hypothetical protein